MLACLLFGAPAWKTRALYRLGPSEARRCLAVGGEQHALPHHALGEGLASHILGRIARQISRDKRSMPIRSCCSRPSSNVSGRHVLPRGELAVRWTHHRTQPQRPPQIPERPRQIGLALSAEIPLSLCALWGRAPLGRGVRRWPSAPPPPPSIAPIPTFPLEEQTPRSRCCSLFEHERRLEMRAQVRALEAEVRRLKGLPPRPNIKSALDAGR